MAQKKGMTINFFHPCLSLLFLDPGSEIRDPGWVKIRIRDKHPGSAPLLIEMNEKVTDGCEDAASKLGGY